LSNVRIALVTPGFPSDTGGVEAVVDTLTRHLAVSGAEVVVFSHGRQRRVDVTPEGVEVRRYPAHGGEFAVSPSLISGLARAEADVWHPHNVHSSLPFDVWLTKRRPYVLSPHFHGSGHSPTARALHVPYAPVLRRIVKDAAVVTADSEYEANLLEERFDRQIEVVPVGVDLASLRSVERFHHTDEKVRVLVVARLSPYKRVDMAIRALALLPSEYVLTVHGRGSEARRLRDLSRTLKLENRVSFDESRVTDRELWQLMADADVMVNVSRAEAFSVAVLESLAVGTPVVTSTSTALREWSARFPDDVTGLSKLSPEAVAEAIVRQAGRRVHPDLTSFDWGTITSRVIDIYGQACRTVAGTGRFGR
jgi:glycosyltransferase involved in cell wall biosynthesis